MTTEDNNITDLNPEIEVEAEAPEQQQPQKWEYRKRQAQKWGTVTKVGLTVGRGDNKKVIPPDEVYYLASLGCTTIEIATWFQIPENTLKYNFADYIQKGREETKQKLRQAQIKLALNGNATMLIFLGKNMLGQSDNPNAQGDDKILPWNDDQDADE